MMTSNRIRAMHRARSSGGAGQDHADEIMAQIAAEEAAKPRPPTLWQRIRALASRPTPADTEDKSC
jgi:hypothetical protein